MICYDSLLELLCSREMTISEISSLTGISGDIHAKAENNKAVGDEIVMKLSEVLGCRPEEIIRQPDEQSQYGISGATIRNWKRLSSDMEGRLTSRANKRKSKKRIIPEEYFSDKNNIPFVQDVMEYIDKNGIPIRTAVLSLGISLLRKAGILEKQNVACVLGEYSGTDVDIRLSQTELPDNEYDILGIIYQSYLYEGKKNIAGSYYTPENIVRNMTKDIDLSGGKLFLDPCCGSGAFLLSVRAEDPCQLFGTDYDMTAVLLSKLNLLLRYREYNFIPQVYCLDFLSNAAEKHRELSGKRFDYIATNPPWGAMRKNVQSDEIMNSRETFSHFFVKAHRLLQDNGMISFLFPESVLKVKKHSDIRRYMIENAGLISITMYDDMFTGVTTRYTGIVCGQGADRKSFSYHSKEGTRYVCTDTIYKTENLVINMLSEEDMDVIGTVRDRGRNTLHDSIWALGIVTGDNRGRLSSVCMPGMERIYTGKEICPYRLKPAANYIEYDRSKLQQTAKDEIYRADEKLVYRFISDKLIFAYDDSRSLFLNSANILIPKIPGMDVKTVMAFLNSMLFRFMYIRLFGEIKILKGNLSKLPFPEISEEDNKHISELVDRIMRGDDSNQAEIDRFIFDIYSLSEEQRKYIVSAVNDRG